MSWRWKKKSTAVGCFASIRNVKEEIVGFKAFYEEVVPRKLEVCFEEDERHAEETMNLKRKLRRQKMQDDLRKVRIYYRQFGVRAAFIRAGEKLSGKNGTEYEEWLRRHEPSKIRLYQQKKRSLPGCQRFRLLFPFIGHQKNICGNAGFCKKTILSELGTLPLRWKWGRFTDYRNSERVYKEG